MIIMNCGYRVVPGISVDIQPDLDRLNNSVVASLMRSIGKYLSVLVSVTAATTLMRADVSGPAHTGWCHPDTMFQNLTREKVEREVTASGAGGQEWRNIMNLPFVSASEITVVQVDSLCMKAGRLINGIAGRAMNEQRAVFLIKVGNRRYWAEDHEFHHGGLPARFILDSTLTTVLSETL